VLASGQADSVSPPTDPKDLELIQTILKHNQATIEKIKSFRLVEEWESISNPESRLPDEPPLGEQRNSCQVTYLASGKFYRGDCKFTLEVASKGYRKESRRQAALNKSSFVTVSRHEDTDVVSLVEHRDIGEMRENERNRAESGRPKNALSYVSASHFDFQHRLENPTTTWTVERRITDEGPCYVISSRDRSGSTASYFFNSEKNFLLTAIDADHADGKRYYEVRVTLAMMQGLWFPELVQEKSTSDSATKLSLRVVKAELNPVIPDSEFDFDKLGIDRSSAVMTVLRESGVESETLIFRDGKWVPSKLFGR
jgi:hypothetical protein